MTRVLISAMLLAGLAIVAAPADAQMVCAPDQPSAGLQTCTAERPVGKYAVTAQAKDAAGNTVTVARTAVPFCEALTLAQRDDKWIFSWVCQKGMTVTFSATPSP